MKHNFIIKHKNIANKIILRYKIDIKATSKLFKNSDSLEENLNYFYSFYKQNSIIRQKVKSTSELMEKGIYK